MTTADRVQLAKLAQRIPGQYIEQVDVGKGRKEAYIPHEVVNQFLLYVLGPFDFEVVELIRGDVAEVPPNPQGQSDRAKAGTPPLRGVVVGARCQLTATIDDETTRITEIGDVEDPHNWSNDGKRAKAAASDGLKRCAMRFGFGLELRAGDQYVLDKWLPIPSKDGQSETSGAGRGGPAPDSASEPAGTSDSEGVPGGAAGSDTTQTTRQRTSRTCSTSSKTKDSSAEPAAPPAAPPAEEEAPAATAQAPPGAAAGATTNGHPADQATTMEELAAALGRSLNNCWLRLRRAGQDDETFARFTGLADAKALKGLQGEDFELARAWLIDHNRQGAAA